jgi:hypothetical protein
MITPNDHDMDHLMRGWTCTGCCRDSVCVWDGLAGWAGRTRTAESVGLEIGDVAGGIVAGMR